MPLLSQKNGDLFSWKLTFFPAFVMKLVAMIPELKTSDEDVQQIVDLKEHRGPRHEMVMVRYEVEGCYADIPHERSFLQYMQET